MHLGKLPNRNLSFKQRDTYLTSIMQKHCIRITAMRALTPRRKVARACMMRQCINVPDAPPPSVAHIRRRTRRVPHRNQYAEAGSSAFGLASSSHYNAISIRLSRTGRFRRNRERKSVFTSLVQVTPCGVSTRSQSVCSNLNY